MAYTSDDLTSIQTAVLALAAGSRKVSATINGKRMEYGIVQLPELMKLRDQIQSEVSSTAERRRFVLTSTVTKGL